MPRIHVFAEVRRLGIGDERGELEFEGVDDAQGDITDEQLEEIRKVRKPTVTMRRIMEAVHLILEGKVPEGGRIEWRDVHRTFTDMRILQRVRQFDIKALGKRRAVLHLLCREYLGGANALTLARARRASNACAAFFSWSLEVAGDRAVTHAWYNWDVDGNPLRHLLEHQSGKVSFCAGHLVDYCTVLTRDPVRTGVHLVEYVMHSIGDEQWCGVTDDPRQAGSAVSGHDLHAWSYYCGRRNNRRKGSKEHAALHCDGVRVQDFQPVKKGDTIGAFLDIDQGALVFLLNGELQGACAVPHNTSLYFLTHLDHVCDCVELRALPISETPEAVLRAAAEVDTKRPATLRDAPAPLHRIGLKGAGAMVIMAARKEKELAKPA